MLIIGLKIMFLTFGIIGLVGLIFDLLEQHGKL
jgi:hypothetical protein